MAFSAGSFSIPSAEINVTPLIDVLLVLLIIFMVIVPVMPRGLSALVPQPPKDSARASSQPPVVVEVKAGPGSSVLYELNRRQLDKAALVQTLDSVMAVRQDKAIFVKADRELEFSAVAEVIGLAHQANAERIGILTPAVEAAK